MDTKKKNEKPKATKKQKKPYVKDKKFRNWLINKLRRLSYMWPARKEALGKARLERGIYVCATCSGQFGPKEIQLDHKIPVVDEETGFVDWNTYIERLFCDESNFQVLCKPCHEAKTFFEREVRKQVKQEQRKNEDDI